MTKHTQLAAAVLAATAAWPAPATAHHTPCRWGPTVVVDPSSPDPVEARFQAPHWGCQGPYGEIRVDAAGQTLALHATREGVEWSREPDDGSSAQTPPARAEREAPAAMRLTVTPRRVRAGRRVRLRIRATWLGESGPNPAPDVIVHLAGRTLVTPATGVVSVRLRPRMGSLRARAYREGVLLATRAVRVVR